MLIYFLCNLLFVLFFFLHCYQTTCSILNHVQHFSIMQLLQLSPGANVLGRLLGQTLLEAPATKIS